MVPKFVEVDRETQFLLPPSVQDWLPKDHLARFVVDVVEQLNLIAVGIFLTEYPPHRSRRAQFTHRAPTLGV